MPASVSNSPVFNLALAAALGVTMVSLAVRLKIPSIALLLLTGILVGPSVLGILQPDALGSGLQFVVGMAVAVILFEGGLTLDLEGARRSPIVIRRMLTVGVLITWLGTALAAWWLLELSFDLALLCGSLVIVTGPTVVSPLLRRIGVRERLKHILYWEAVLIDAIGVFIAVLCLEWLVPDAGRAWSPLLRFGARVALGAGVGIFTGITMALLLRHHVIPDEQVNIFVLGVALFAYAACEAVLPESGILAVIIAGLIVGMTKPKDLDNLKRFKLELTELGIGMLFILLSARLQVSRFFDYGWGLLATIGVLLLVLRPLAIATATVGHRFSVQEKLFLSWIAPRGIIAAFMASLFALELSHDPEMAAQAPILETFTFAVIGITVVIQGFSASWVARVLGLRVGSRQTWLIVGDVAVAGALAKGVRAAGGSAVALAPIDKGEEPASPAPHIVHHDPLDRSLLDDPRFADIGHVLSATPNLDFDQLVCQRWSEVVGKDGCTYICSHEELEEAKHRHDPHALCWDGIDPGDLLHGLDAGSLAVTTFEIGPDEDPGRFGPHVTPLLWVDAEGQVSIWREGQLSEITAPGQTVAAYQRIPDLDVLVGDALVVPDEQATFDEVVENLLAAAAQHQPNLGVEALKQSILERERSMPTALGSGVAIPHAYCPSAEHSRCYVANVPAGIDANTPDSEPIHLVFLVLSPVGKAEDHLRSLASIARLVHDRSYVSFLERQGSSEELLSRIHERA
ncbi:cation:proton antiporter [Haliangium ochraceum]|uniref:Sodium/hydrogen exchanger n=1 Tax=Haliangium ochraceum (strain DSM 14365 / JCM 11303 / SMP-2) TaxID=502025 RepID=D0LM53_HALO1|nr:cation:proton antiporter [Haliangium ochraceum]ACY16759.1 sodium/hydrogen exchanger [Haliangium ochraceum DSM 14365]